MNLVWKLLRRHISLGQFAGFFFANLAGMLIVLVGYQFYRDVVPVFTAEDSFMKSDFIVVSKRIGAGATLAGGNAGFTHSEIDELERQPYVTALGRFSAAEYKLDASMGIGGHNILNSELFIESVPDAFVDIPLADWHYQEGQREVPVVVPRSYINMYNFGYAQMHGLPRVGDGLVGMIDFQFTIHGRAGERDSFRGRVVGLSSRLNSILVPQSFIEWSNQAYAPGEQSAPSRLLLRVTNPTDERIAQYVDSHAYEIDDDKLNAEKTAFFLRLIVMLVVGVGLLISALSFYILMLSIYLLVQKNTTKLQNLLLIGYSPARVAVPYQLLSLVLNAAVVVLALLLVSLARHYYLDLLLSVFPQLSVGSLLPSVGVAFALFLVVTLVNQLAIRRKVTNIWKRKE